MATVLIIIAPEQLSEKELFIINTELENAGYKTIIWRAFVLAGIIERTAHYAKGRKAHGSTW